MSIYVLDGGFSTQVSRYVGDKIDGDPLWTAKLLVTDPDAVKKTHLDFLNAGSDIIETNTYQATITGFKKYMNLTEEEGTNLIKKASTLAHLAVSEYLTENPDADVKIFGSIGPYGAALHDGSEYTGSYADFTSEEVMREWHKPRFEALLKSGITNFAIETIPCEKEALVLAKFLKEYPTIKAWMSFSCKDDKLLAHGEVFHEVASKVYNSNPDQIIAVGVNCLNPLYVTKLLKPINENRSSIIPLVVYPNSGEKYTDGMWHSSEDKIPPLADFIDEWLPLGVKYFGGCCRTKAEDIKAIKNKLLFLKNNKLLHETL